MTPKQKLEVRAAEIRAELNALAIIDTPSEDQLKQLTELRTEYGVVDQRLAALITAEENDPPATANIEGENGEGNETRSDPLTDLMGRCNVGNIYAAALEMRSIDGAERELQQELGLNGNQIPLQLLNLETRAVTPAPATQGASQAEILPYVFPNGAAAFMGIPQPSVPVGQRVYPILTTPATPGTPAKSANQPESTGAFGAKNLAPARIQASFFYAREDAASFAGMDAALRANLSDAMSDKLDSVIIAGLLANGKAVDMTASVWGYTEYTNIPYDGIDGRYASVAADTRILVGADTYKLMAQAFSNTTTQLAPTALGRLQAESGGIRVGASIPKIASKKTKILTRLGSRQDAVAPIWQGITLIPDEITKAGTGEIVLTSVMLYAFGVLRDDSYRVTEYKTAA